jgi:hypothetical protein
MTRCWSSNRPVPIFRSPTSKRFCLVAEAREMAHGVEPMVRYHVVVNGNVSLDDVSRQMVNRGQGGITSVRWEMLKQKGQ